MGLFNRKTAALGLLAVGASAAPQAATKTADAQAAPATYTANPNVGPGGSNFKDSAHFRIYGGSAESASQAIDMLEGAYDCFTNVYSVDVLEGAAGVMHSDYETGLAWLEVVNEYLAVPGVTVHEYGHGMHYHQKTWVDQGRTGAWWETLTNWVANTYKTSDICATARKNHNQEATNTEIELQKVLGDAHQPFLTYLTNNPDQFAGLGQDTIRQLMLQYKEGSNKTPLHTLARVSQNATVGDIVGRYWARMANVDIGHPSAHELFVAQKDSINFANVESSGSGYKPKSGREPRYMGANIIPLTVSGSSVSVKVASDSEFVATVVIYREGGESSYVTLANGAATVSVKSGEQVSVVVANAPAEPILYDSFNLSADVSKGLDYTLTLTGATVQAQVFNCSILSSCI
ncbi:hypothetical protein FALBO_2804 [Fusarium albosuccineum]|uniref:Dockerin type 1 n=1 Tax=Fusarium albosuccineum TaxID=1237068 RepID=A0A8H4LLG1_9HYPO|nr:hypothetical protein FALBO_2804 [Fusarium albosuccineum]